jgi:glycine/D-amino acid oxidase-like deaminating enzyme
VARRTWRFRPWCAAGSSGRSSLWVEEALALERGAWEDAHRLEGAVRADVCIVGGGFTGLWTAIRLRELDPALDVVLIEAELCGTGASGRNGGMVSDWWVKLPTLVKRFGTEDGVRLARTIDAGADELARFCANEGVDARLTRRGSFWTATNDAQRGTVERVLAAARAAGVEPFREVARDELEATLGSPLHRSGVFDSRGGALQPALLARGLRRVALARGIDVCERSPVTVIEAGGRIRIRAGEGTVEADRVVLAANAWMAHLPEFRRTVFVVSSDVVATAPAPELFARLAWRDDAWTGGEGAFDARTLIEYWRTTVDGRVVFGRGGGTLAFAAHVGSAFERSNKQRPRVEADLRRAVPAFADVPVTHSWAGAVERTSNGLLRIGRLGGDERLVYAIGYSGSGVVPSVTVGRCLASTLLGRDDEWADVARLLGGASPRLPPEPVRYLGGLIVQRAVAGKERAEDAGRTPTRAARLMAGLAPGGLASPPSGER